MYEARRKIFWFAIISRIIVLSLQFIFNLLCPDHDADAFKSPTDNSEQISLYDSLITILFGGLARWDGEYFLHIAKYGYTYENTLAFYPLYPFSVLIAAMLVNVICFVKSAVIFYDLSKTVLKTTNVAYKAAILYCINPATIFFSAAYSESLFAYLTMLRSIKLDPYVSFPISLSILTRSNGVINIGFPIYYQLQKLSYDYSKKHANFSLKTFCQFMFKASTLKILPGNSYVEWCHLKIPMAYSYIQKKYWNLGFLNYYEIKQIPNFILAFPILYIMMKCIKEFFFEHKKYFYTLGFIKNTEDNVQTERKKYPIEMLVFVIHVSTRLISSASPLIYWYCALLICYTSYNNDNLYDEKENDMEL
ncbi:LOW QUALITY PROTEIN: hypothetical protein E2986_05855 [Frieseomelitta varia]|uniref:GPI mannosyltransferase 2 n=1 Tax=Frieseomelitta varia TaxID=561572 RepID=A0A833RN58_9HYME|nr:LOW QUALITY PROTEIN: hypothetical protein E2986_05855 [Frieseomelitta varia]